MAAGVKARCPDCRMIMGRWVEKPSGKIVFRVGRFEITRGLITCQHCGREFAIYPPTSMDKIRRRGSDLHTS